MPEKQGPDNRGFTVSAQQQKQDIGCTTEVVYGTTLRIVGEFFNDS